MHCPALATAMRVAVLLSAAFSSLLQSQSPPPAMFGTVKTEAGYRALLAMDAVHNVKPNTKYPAVMLTAGMFDSRVEAWPPAKMAAALQENSTSGYPVLLRVDFDAGHGMGLAKSQRSAELADIYAFLLWQLGAPEFQFSP
jgi:prolyl oligopeptidase